MFCFLIMESLSTAKVAQRSKTAVFSNSNWELSCQDPGSNPARDMDIVEPLVKIKITMSNASYF